MTWLNWGLLKSNSEIYQFTKDVIAFRKDFPVLHMKNGLRLMDYKACGYPDLSYHSEEAWHPQTDNYIRHIGMMYCCAYAKEDCKEQLLYAAVNMHWEKHEFGLPMAPEEKWEILFATENGKEQPVLEEKKISVPARSIVVLVSRKK